MTINVSCAHRSTIIQRMAMKMHRNSLTDQSWLRFTCSTSALLPYKLHCFFKIMDYSPHFTAEDSAMLETFKQMGSLLTQERYARPDVARESKKHKPNGATPEEPDVATLPLLRAMGQLLLRVDAEQQALKRQDSWICFMQTEPQALLPALVQKAAEWKQRLTVKQETPEVPFLPLRCYLAQHLAATLNQRVTRLASCGNEDPLKKVALDQGVLTRKASLCSSAGAHKHRASSPRAKPPSPCRGWRSIQNNSWRS